MENKYVKWQTFVWVISIITIVLGYLVNTQIGMNKDLNNNNVEFAKLQTKLASIETTLLEIKTDIKSHMEKDTK